MAKEQTGAVEPLTVQDMVQAEFSSGQENTAKLAF